MVSVRREWWDDEVFEQYPTWEDALDDSCNYFGKRTGKNPSPILTKYFGEEPSGQGNYARCAKYGIGREVLSKMLSEKSDDIKQALTSLPLTARSETLFKPTFVSNMIDVTILELVLVKIPA